jgi:hypothetical protein
MKVTEINVFTINATHGSAFLDAVCSNRRNRCLNGHSPSSLTAVSLLLELLQNSYIEPYKNLLMKHSNARGGW